MTLVMINHKVKDFNVWKPYFDADRDRRSAAGLKEVYVTRKADEPNHVYVLFETNDIEKSQKMMEDPSLHKVMEQAGVLGPPTFTVLNKA